MNFFRKKKPADTKDAPQSTGVSAGLPKAGDPLPESLKAHSRFIKRVNCSQCGAPKTLPSATAYLYCDYCGALMDYDFRLANHGTNAGITNTVFHRLVARVQEPLVQARAHDDRETYRQLYRWVYTQWVQECPLAVSPRAKNDPAFREQLINYLAECVVVKDLDPNQAPLDARMQLLLASLQRIPSPGGAWQVAGGFWPYAELYKEQMILAYDLIHKLGVDAMDPDHAPSGVALRMEYSTFCQAWLPHLSAEDGEKLLKLYGLTAEYDEIKPQPTDHHQCGACGAVIQSLQGARQVVCDTCGFTIDVGGAAVPCRKCGALLSFPVASSQVNCPYCSTDTRRV